MGNTRTRRFVKKPKPLTLAPIMSLADIEAYMLNRAIKKWGPYIPRVRQYMRTIRRQLGRLKSQNQ